MEFVGPDNAKLFVSFSIYRVEVLGCSLKIGDEVVSKAGITDDNYDYYIFIEPGNIFSNRQLIDTGTCFLGDKDVIRFKIEKLIKLEKWTQQLHILRRMQ